MDTPSVIAAVTLQEPEDATVENFKSPQPPSHEVNSLPVDGSSSDVVVLSEIPSQYLSPSDDDFDHERISGEDRDHDHGDNPIETDIAVPADELKKKIIRRVEYYFSDENLPTENFLLNAMKRNKKGFVPISTIATFHKMKKLTRDHALVVAALKESSFLVVSLDGKKVKRLSPLPEIRDPKKICQRIIQMRISGRFLDSGNDKNGNKGRGGGRGRRHNHLGGNGIGHGTAPSASSSSHHIHHPVEVSKRPPGPRMPDGTRGFTMGRGKALPPPTSAQTSPQV